MFEGEEDFFGEYLEEEKKEKGKGKKKEEQEFKAGFKDVQRTGGDFGEQEDELDPRTKSINLFKKALESLSCLKEKINDETHQTDYYINNISYQNVKNHIKEQYNQILLLNMDLLALAVCYFSQYTKIDEENITKYINSTAVKHFLTDKREKNIIYVEIDIIRYIKFYDKNKYKG